MKGEKITVKLVKALQPRKRAYEIYDCELRGFMIRVQPSGSMTYYARYRTDAGKQTRVKLGPVAVLTVTQARDAAKAALADVAKGEDPGERRRAAKAHTLGSFVDQVYKPWAVGNLKDGAGAVVRLKSSFASLQKRKLSEITAWAVEKWRAKRLKGKKKNGDAIKAATVNRDVAYLKAALSRAVQWGLLDEHPLKSVKLAREDTSAQIRYLSDDEEDRLIAALDQREERIRKERDSHNTWLRERGHPELPDLRAAAYADYLKPMAVLGLHTGLRRGEIFNLTWQDIDFERAVLTVQGRGAKSSRTRHIPLNQSAMAVLEAWRAQSHGEIDLVFPNPKTGRRFGNIARSWRQLVKDAKLDAPFRFHDLRHTFASRLVMAGVDLNTVRELLGHSTIQTTLRYAHLAPEVKAKAVAKLDAPSNVVNLQAASAQQ